MVEFLEGEISEMFPDVAAARRLDTLRQDDAYLSTSNQKFMKQS